MDDTHRKLILASGGRAQFEPLIGCGDLDLVDAVRSSVPVTSRNLQLQFLLGIWDRHGGDVARARMPATFTAGVRRIIENLPAEDAAALAQLRAAAWSEASPQNLAQRLRTPRDTIEPVLDECFRWDWEVLLAEHRRAPFPIGVLHTLRRMAGCPDGFREPPAPKAPTATPAPASSLRLKPARRALTAAMDDADLREAVRAQAEKYLGRDPDAWVLALRLVPDFAGTVTQTAVDSGNRERLTGRQQNVVWRIDGCAQDSTVTVFDDELIELRREIHCHPELAGEERETAGLVAEQLRAAGLEVTTGVGGHGVLAVLDGSADGPTAVYRADMDAVDAQHNVYRFPRSDRAFDEGFASRVPGVAHLCGHDLHTAIGVGVARTLAQGPAPVRGRLAFVFQAAEEPLQGARAMLETGLVQRLAPRESYALHCCPLPAGTIAMQPVGDGLFLCRVRYASTFWSSISVVEVSRDGRDWGRTSL